MLKKLTLFILLNLFLISNTQAKPIEIYGTDEDFAKESIYFVITDRFVDGDKSNNYEQQGGENPTWLGEIKSKDGKEKAYVGYMGGDFKGLYENVDYIKDMGFSSVWITPIVDNPNKAFSGGKKVEFSREDLNDGGKSGYHGYWGTNFYKEDEHLISKGYSFKEFANKMHSKNMKVVLDIVCNHSSPAYTMPERNSTYGQVFDKDGNLVADHQNLHPSQLNHNNPLHQFYNKKPGLAQLGDFNENNPKVLDYVTNAYLQWIDQGADAFRLDTYAWLPHSFWKKFADRIRAKHPKFFMVGEVFSYDDKLLAKYQLPENGDITIFDFYLQNALIEVFQTYSTLGYNDLLYALHLDDGTYTNPYELVTFYDNHDMSRLDGREENYIDIHNWLFTARGIPCIYYGSEIGFMPFASEHNGSRNYYGVENIKKAPDNKIYQNLKKAIHIRNSSIALQKGVQINLDFQKDTAAFLRIYQKDNINQTALVLLNKSDKKQKICINKYLNTGTWIDDSRKHVYIKNSQLKRILDPHSVQVLFFNKPVNNQHLLSTLKTLKYKLDKYAKN